MRKIKVNCSNTWVGSSDVSTKKKVLLFVEGAVAKLLVKYTARYFKRANSGSAQGSCTCLAHVLHMSCTTGLS